MAVAELTLLILFIAGSLFGLARFDLGEAAVSSGMEFLSIIRARGKKSSWRCGRFAALQ